MLPEPPAPTVVGSSVPDSEGDAVRSERIDSQRSARFDKDIAGSANRRRRRYRRDLIQKRQRRSLAFLVTRMPLHGRVNLRLDGFQIEARALLHRREVEGSLGKLCHPLLHEYKSPELVGEPVVEGQ
jgi:IS5 family transposase